MPNGLIQTNASVLNAYLHPSRADMRVHMDTTTQDVVLDGVRQQIQQDLPHHGGVTDACRHPLDQTKNVSSGVLNDLNSINPFRRVDLRSIQQEQLGEAQDSIQRGTKLVQEGADEISRFAGVLIVRSHRTLPKRACAPAHRSRHRTWPRGHVGRRDSQLTILHVR